MPRSSAVALLLLLSACAGPSGGEVPRVAPGAVGMSGAGLEKVDAVLSRLAAEGKIAGGVVAVARNGKVAHVAVAGKLDLETGRPMREDAIFRIYSMTKAIVTAAALTLVEEGRLRLDDPVAKHVPELADLRVADGGSLRPPRRPPTVEDLMLHTAGFTYGGGPAPCREAYGRVKPLDAKDLDGMARRLAEVPLAFDPGSSWMYSCSIDVLGLVVERVSGARLDAFLRERIFGPLDMKDTGFFVPPEKLDRFTANYRTTDGGLKRIDGVKDSKYAEPPAFLSGGGGLVSTARDYLRFLLMVEGGGALQGVRVLRPETVRLMTADRLPDAAFPIRFGKQVRHGTGFGLGFSVRTTDTEWDPQARVGEFGWGGAASTHYWVSPRDRLAVVTLEQRRPFTFETENLLKGPIYDAILD